MTNQPTGVRRPEVALELAQTAAAARAVAAAHLRVSAHPLEWDAWVDVVAADLERRSTGELRELCASALRSAWSAQLRREIDQHGRVLAKIAGLTLPAARTEAGWRRVLAKVLRDAGHGPDAAITAQLLSTLPGTELVLLVHRIATLQEAGSIDIEFNRAWQGATRKGTVEKEITRLKKAGLPNATRLAWAVIGLESHRHVNLIWHQANKLERVFPDREASDLLAYGWMGLRTALLKYDLDLGFAFSTYACTRITGSIRDGVRAESPVPKRLGTFARKVAAAEAELTQSMGRSPSLEEVSAFLGTEIERLKIVPRLGPEASVDEIMSGAAEHGGVPSWAIDASVSPEAHTEHVMVSEAIEAALGKLEGEEAEAIRLLIMEELHPTAARQLTGATARQMRQRRDRGVEQLREFLSGWDPEITDSR